MESTCSPLTELANRTAASLKDFCENYSSVHEEYISKSNKKHHKAAARCLEQLKDAVAATLTLLKETQEQVSCNQDPRNSPDSITSLVAAGKRRIKNLTSSAEEQLEEARREGELGIRNEVGIAFAEFLSSETTIQFLDGLIQKKVEAKFQDFLRSKSEQEKSAVGTVPNMQSPPLLSAAGHPFKIPRLSSSPLLSEAGHPVKRSLSPSEGASSVMPSQFTKYILKGIPVKYSLEDIHIALNSIGIKSTKLHRLLDPQTGHGRLLVIFYSNSSIIPGIVKLFDIAIHIELFNERRSPADVSSVPKRAKRPGLPLQNLQGRREIPPTLLPHRTAEEMKLEIQLETLKMLSGM